MSPVPIVALAAPRHSAARALPLLRVLGIGVDVVSFRRHERTSSTPPDAIVATSVAALPVLPPVPTAVWVESADELALALGIPHVVAVLTSDPQRAGGDSRSDPVYVPRHGIDVDRWPALAPLVRARWRQRHGLPERLVVGIDPPLPDARPAGPLALASAAIVVGEHTPLALALGAPTVTSEANAKRFGLRPGVEVEVAAGPKAAAALADQIAATPAQAAFLSRRGRRAAERLLDVGPSSRLLRVRLGLDHPAPPGLDARLVDRLAELGTPESAPLRRRVAAALAPLEAS